jgi:hypothetical protein
MYYSYVEFEYVATGFSPARTELAVKLLKYNSQLIFDPTYPLIDDSTFQHHDWEEFYGDVQEAIPTNAPPPLGKEVDLRMMIDSNHAGDKATRRSRTGFLIF